MPPCRKLNTDVGVAILKKESLISDLLILQRAHVRAKEPPSVTAKLARRIRIHQRQLRSLQNSGKLPRSQPKMKRPASRAYVLRAKKAARALKAAAQRASKAADALLKSLK